ncbi:MAG: agmatine deiminase family protein [Candidatus Omnitrophica bacterium]|nr:agmatine deiminase family protein [Candidatus Omnitrophota bacterium]
MSGQMLYFSALLPKRFPECFDQISRALSGARIDFKLLPYTQDIWCRDYMPVWRPPESISVLNHYEPGYFMQFKYRPSYLKSPRWRATITNPVKTCQAIGITPKHFDLVVDGGNVVQYGYKAIMTERVFKENPRYRKATVYALLTDLLNVDELIMIPEEPGDPYGHADGCVRFVNKNTVMINEIAPGQKIFGRKLRDVLRQHGLRWIDLPYFIEKDSKNKHSAVGNYVNFLNAGDLVLVPTYVGYPEWNQRAIKILRRAFAGEKVVPIESTVLAKEGGVLNCVSWECVY